MSLFRLSYQGLLSSSWRPRKPPSASQVCVFACKSSYFYIIISPRNWLKTSVSPTLTNYPQPAQLEESLLRHLAGVVIHGNVLLQTLKTLPLQFCIISGSQTLSRVASITSCTQGIEQVLLNIMLFKCKLILTYVILQFLINVPRVINRKKILLKPFDRILHNVPPEYKEILKGLSDWKSLHIRK